VGKDRTLKHFSSLASQLEEYGFSCSPFMKIRHAFVAHATLEDSRSAASGFGNSHGWPQPEPYTVLINQQIRSFF
jgi:hypothetical protein